MIAERLGPRASLVKVVNPNPVEIVRRLESLGIDNSRISDKSGRDACADYVSDLEDDAARTLSTSIKHEPQDLRVLVSIAEPWTAAVIDVKVEPETRDRALLILEPGQVGIARATRLRDPNEASPLTLASLRSKIGDRRILEIEFKGGNRARLIGKSQWTPATGHNGNWLILVPSAIPGWSYQEI
jgi:hypothetical protein